MIGDWIFIIGLTITFIVVIVLSIIVLNAANGITPSLRKTDSDMRNAYTSLKNGGYIALITGIVGAVVVLSTILAIVINPLVRFLDKIPRYGKIIIKTLFGVAAAALIIVAGIDMARAAADIKNSRTYRISKLGARKELDSSIASINLAAMIYYITAAVLVFMFVSMAIYDAFKPNAKKKEEMMEALDMVKENETNGPIDLDKVNDTQYNKMWDVGPPKLTKEPINLDNFNTTVNMKYN